MSTSAPGTSVPSTQISMCDDCWNRHGKQQPCPTSCGCHSAFSDTHRDERNISAAVDRLRKQTATEKLIAELDQDAASSAGRIRGVLSLLGRDLTDSEVKRIAAALRAELLSYQIKVTDLVNREWFDLVATR